jgi:hypothetical protein
MKKLILISVLIFITNYIHCQGTNNNYPIDNEDLVNILKMQGINVFKFPFTLNKGDYISISFEVYEFGELINQRKMIEDFQKEKGFWFDHHISRSDTTVYHRFYFQEKNDTLFMKLVVPGLSMPQEFNISKIYQGSYNALSNVPKNIDGKTELMHYYGIYKGSELNKKNGSMLHCTTGLSKDNLIKRNDFVIIFYADKITGVGLINRDN